jgi:enoyl-CoA hydratase/carnithine racemase
VSAVSLAQSAGGVCLLTLDRPPANALNLGALIELIAAVEEVDAQSPAALVITGTREFFSGGADLKDPPVTVEGVVRTNEMALKLFSLPFPVVAAVNGHAIGSGLIVALCCDARIGSTAGRYGLTEVAHGFSYPQAAFDVVRATLMPQAAQRIILGSELLEGDVCLRLGVFDEVLPAESVLPRAAEEAQRRAALPAAAYARAKTVLRGVALAEMRRSAAGDPLLG